MALIGKNPGFGSGIDIFTAIELSLINSMEILDSNSGGCVLDGAGSFEYNAGSYNMTSLWHSPRVR